MLHQELSFTLQRISDDINASYMWELAVDAPREGEEDKEEVACEFALEYQVVGDNQSSHKCSYSFVLENFKVKKTEWGEKEIKVKKG